MLAKQPAETCPPLAAHGNGLSWLDFRILLLCDPGRPGAEPLCFLKYTDTNLFLRIFKTLPKSLIVTRNTLGCCKFRG